MKFKYITLSVATALLMQCASTHLYVPPKPLPDDRRDIPEPAYQEFNLVYNVLDKQIINQVDQSFDFARQLRNVTGKPKQAFNVTAFDEVENSSWFTNRNATQRMSMEDFRRGPDTCHGPDTTGKWMITRAKGEGITPGFHIKNSNGDRYVIKFDPPGYSELATGAEVVSTKLFYAAGYNTPENYIVTFNQDILVMGDDVKFTDNKGKKRPMNETDLEELLSRIERQPDGRIRALASKYVPGIPKGPYAYEGYRKDDPNDFVPHDYRRELRAIRVMAAWLNHTDAKSGNSFDSYVVDNGKHYIRHYLIDFGSTLGSASHGPMEPQYGYENQIDPHQICLNILLLGLYVRPWEKQPGVKYPSIGLYESSMFDPFNFEFNIPIPAFENCTSRDGYWGAKLVMSFTDEQLEAAVAEGQYSDPEAAAYLVKILRERRDKTGRYWFGRINPIDDFELLKSGNTCRLTFHDLSVDTGLEQAEGTRYRYCVLKGGKDIIPQTVVETPVIDLEDVPVGEQIAVQIETARNGSDNWGKWVQVYVNGEEDGPVLVGLERE